MLHQNTYVQTTTKKKGYEVTLMGKKITSPFCQHMLTTVNKISSC